MDVRRTRSRSERRWQAHPTVAIRKDATSQEAATSGSVITLATRVPAPSGTRFPQDKHQSYSRRNQTLPQKPFCHSNLRSVGEMWRLSRASDRQTLTRADYEGLAWLVLNKTGATGNVKRASLSGRARLHGRHRSTASRSRARQSRGRRPSPGPDRSSATQPPCRAADVFSAGAPQAR
jgi:hypothetical protein